MQQSRAGLEHESDTRSVVDLVLDDVVGAIRSGRPVLLQAALQGHADVLRYLLQRITTTSSDFLPSSPDQLGKALAEAYVGAAEEGHSQCFTVLVESGAPFLNVDGLVNARNERGETALMVAAKQGRGDCVKIFLQHNPEAQVTAKSKDGDTALILAAANGHAAVVTQLLQHSPRTQVAAANGNGTNALMYAARRGHAECVGQLLQQHPGVQVVAADKAGDTALIWAAWTGHAACVRQLLKHTPGAQVEAANSKGVTALMSAVTKNHSDFPALLLGHAPSIQIGAVDAAGQPAVATAAHGRPQCLDLLLAHDPQPQHLDAALLTAVRRWDAANAHTSPHTQCLERLLAKGAVLPTSAHAADKAKHQRFIQDLAARALVADRANEAIVGLAASARGTKRKAGQGGEQ